MNMNVQLTGFYTLFRKDVVRIFRIWIQSLLPAVITSALYFIIFGKVLGKHIQSIQGFSYLQYIAPGVVMMQMITSSYANASSTIFGAKFNRSIEELLVSPMAPSIIILSTMASSMLRAFIVGVLVLLVAFVFGGVHFSHPLVMILAAIGTTAIFSLLGFLNAIYAKKFDDVAFVPSFVLTPLNYLGGVFYSISALPWFWQKLSLANPIVYAIDAFRYGFLGLSSVNVNMALLMIFVFAAGLYAFCLYLFQRGIGFRT